MASAVATVALRKTMKSAPLARELTISLLSIAPALLAVRMTELSRFHGAEHKSVAAFETGGDPRTAAKEHDRCGTNLLGPIMLTNLAGGLVLRATGRDDEPLPTLLMGLVSLGSAFEIFSWMSRHRGHPLADALRAPGLTLQRLLTTREPTGEQLDVAQAALGELLRLRASSRPAAAARPVTSRAWAAGRLVAGAQVGALGSRAQSGGWSRVRSGARGGAVRRPPSGAARPRLRPRARGTCVGRPSSPRATYTR